VKQLQNLVINKTKERRLLHKWGRVRPAEIGFQPAHTISRARGQAATGDFESTCHIHGSEAEAQPREVIWILFVGCRDRVRPPGELLPRTDGVRGTANKDCYGDSLALVPPGCCALITCAASGCP
jgi:hypothetical protein